MRSLDITFGDEGIQERMATAPTQHYGAIAAFDSTKESWTNYVERLSFYFIANDIAEDADGKRKAILLSVCGHETYQLIRNLVGGAEAIKDAQYADMIKLITFGHCSTV